MYKITKRLTDIVVSALMLILLSPVLFTVAVLLRFTGERKIFYLQRRIGYKNKPFNVYKFVTMVEGSLNKGTRGITLRNDPRVTAVGRVLRKTKINELPQLLNVFLGQMTLVGPRPFIEDLFLVYPDHVRSRIYDCRPGLTGLGSIVYRDEEAIISASHLSPAECYKELIAPHKGELELWYQEHRSLRVDFLIIVLTAVIVVAPNTGSWIYTLFKDLPKPQRPDQAVA